MKLEYRMCRHCGCRYTYQASGYPVRPHNNSDYCPECYAVIEEALSKIPVRYENRFKELSGEETNSVLIYKSRLLEEEDISGFPIMWQLGYYKPGSLSTWKVVYDCYEYRLWEDDEHYWHSEQLYVYDKQEERFDCPAVVEGGNDVYSVPNLSYDNPFITDIEPVDMPEPKGDFLFIDFQYVGEKQGD